MKADIKNIWIESEEKGSILTGQAEINDNSDVIVTLYDGSKYIATLFTFKNIEHLRDKNKKTGECLKGKYFWASDMILVGRIVRNDIEELINHLIEVEEFDVTFRKIK